MIDERRIRQVLINLLSNAVKFTPEGGQITLKVEYSSQPVDVDAKHSSLNIDVTQLPLKDLTSRSTVRFSIQDTGIGIAPEHIERLFEPFVQVDSALNRHYSGTGLGLALVKDIVELHGGTVGLTSEVGVGSCFTFDLPCEKYDSRTAVSLIHKDMPGAEHDQPLVQQHNSPLILLAEDNEANILTMSSYLTAKGYKVCLAKNGREAVDQVQSEHPDLILMDIQMPEMDGLEAIQKIRQISEISSIPIIALTALTMEGDQEKCLQAGANDYLSKPVSLKQLVTLIQRLLEDI
jgi:CheY-like chemotaxis protein